MSLYGCSNKPPEVITETIYQKEYIPLGMLKIDCVEEGAGLTVQSLASSWVKNRGCLRAYKSLVDDIIKNYTEEGKQQ